MCRGVIPGGLREGRNIFPYKFQELVIRCSQNRATDSKGVDTKDQIGRGVATALERYKPTNHQNRTV